MTLRQRITVVIIARLREALSREALAIIMLSHDLNWQLTPRFLIFPGKFRVVAIGGKRTYGFPQVRDRLFSLQMKTIVSANNVAYWLIVAIERFRRRVFINPLDKIQIVARISPRIEHPISKEIVAGVSIVFAQNGLIVAWIYFMTNDIGKIVGTSWRRPVSLSRRTVMHHFRATHGRMDL
ncbi:hypothetical protein WI37_25540 [Burkholderia ubonensis]|nr:hypothetical protein WI37_25540 [Burkholderia ubonensis]